MASLPPLFAEPEDPEPDDALSPLLSPPEEEPLDESLPDEEELSPEDPDEESFEEESFAEESPEDEPSAAAAVSRWRLRVP